MSTLPFLPLIDGPTAELQLTPGTYSQLVADTLGALGTDADGMPLAIGNLAVKHAAFASAVNDLNLDVSTIPSGDAELDLSSVAATLPILDDADALVAGLSGVPGLVTDAALSQQSGTAGGGAPGDDCTQSAGAFDAVVDFGTFVVGITDEMLNLPGGVHWNPKGRVYIWSYVIQFGDPEVFGVAVDPANTFAHPPRLAYLIARTRKVGTFFFRATFWFIDDTHGYTLCAKIKVVSSLPPAPTDNPALAGCPDNGAIPYDAYMNLGSAAVYSENRLPLFPAGALTPGLSRSGGVVTAVSEISIPINPGSTVIIAGPDDASFAGRFVVTRAIDSQAFQFNQDGPDAVSGNGTVALAPVAGQFLNAQVFAARLSYLAFQGHVDLIGRGNVTAVEMLSVTTGIWSAQPVGDPPAWYIYVQADTPGEYRASCRISFEINSQPWYYVCLIATFQ